MALVRRLQECLHGLLDVLDLLSRLEACHYLTLLVDQELGEVPLDLCALLVIGISLRQHLVENGIERMGLIPASEALLALEELIQRIGIVAIHLQLLEAGEVGAIVELAELMDRLVCAGSLLAKLIAREIQDLKALCVICLIKFLQLCIGGSETAFRCSVDNEQHLVAFPLSYRDIPIKKEAFSATTL